MYVNGSAGTNATYAANRAAFASYPIVPRMLRDATARHTAITLFGTHYASPVLMAPIGVAGIVHADAELAAAAAAARVGVPYILSTAATRSIEEVAEANGSGQRWFQLYWCVLRRPRSPINDIPHSGRARMSSRSRSSVARRRPGSPRSW